MKIAFVLDTFPALSETFILSQIVGLIELGHEVDLFAEQRLPQRFVHDEVKTYRLIEKTTYFRKPPSNKTVARAALLARLLVAFLKHPARTVHVFRQLCCAPKGFSYSAFYQIYPFLFTSYDVIHCHFGMRGEIGRWIKKVGLCRNLVVTFYGYDVSGYVKQCGRDVYKSLFQEADTLMVLSNSMKHVLVDLGAPEKKIAIHRLGVNPDLFAYRERKPVMGRPINLLTVARLTEKKGLMYSILSIARVLKRNSSLDLVYRIVGEGELKESLEKLIEENDLQSRVLLCGSYSQTQVRQFMKEADLFILPSITAENGDQEGTPTAILEALCSGLPVLSTFHAGIPEMIINGKSGFLVPEKDIDALADKLEYMLEHQDQWPKMSLAARKHFDINFNINKLNQELEQIYEKLIK